ncbi:hypothetical protein MKEN_01264500 [Mycena kentingensis (nom. inval.)]|nr:hypothetical protein MKEN_01264500 [Mycena kentingensis (nom. inval.)]
MSNSTVDDSSPFLTYSPYADGSLTAGWIPWYADSGYLSKPGQGGAGESFHRTSFSGASVSLKFYGTGVYLYGSTNSSFEVAVDGQSSKYEATTSDLLFSKTELKEGTHEVTLTARPTGTQQLAFDRAEFTLPYANPPTELFYDNSDTSIFKYSGNWTTRNAEGIPNATVSHSWQGTDVAGSSVSMEFSGAVAVALRGMANYGGWVYTVTLDDVETNHNGSTYWKVPDALLFYQAGLDPNEKHTISLKNTGQTLNLNSMRVYQLGDAAASPNSPGSTGTAASGSPAQSDTADTSTASTGAIVAEKHTSVNAGAIAGPIVAVALLALVAGWFWMRRRRRGRRSMRRGSADLSEDLEKPPHRPMLPSTYGSLTVPTLGSTYASPTTEAGATSIATSWENRASVANSNMGSSVRSPTVGSTHVSSTSGYYRSLQSTSPQPQLGGKAAMMAAAAPAPIVTPAPAAAALPAGAASPTPAGLDSHDVDRLVELIAQRIDSAGSGRQEDGAAPPQYQHSF